MIQFIDYDGGEIRRLYLTKAEYEALGKPYSLEDVDEDVFRRLLPRMETRVWSAVDKSMRELRPRETHPHTVEIVNRQGFSRLNQRDRWNRMRKPIPVHGESSFAKIGKRLKGD